MSCQLKLDHDNIFTAVTLLKWGKDKPFISLSVVITLKENILLTNKKILDYFLYIRFSRIKVCALTNNEVYSNSLLHSLPNYLM